LSPDWPSSPGKYGPHHGGRVWDRRDEFEINDEGWLVWVGKGNHYTEGFSKNLWGTSTNIAGINYEWGIPNWWLGTDGAPRRERFATNAQHNFGWGNNLRLGAGLTAHMQWMAIVGQVIVDHNHSGFSDLASSKHDQFGKPDQLKKPARAHFGINGPGGQYHKERADVMKLRTLSLNYALSPDNLDRLGLAGMGMRTLTLGLVGRDLLNIHNCACPDAEQSYFFLTPELEGTGRNHYWTSTMTYPSSATFTAEIQMTF
jgi:hypothetical protein